MYSEAIVHSRVSGLYLLKYLGHMTMIGQSMKAMSFLIALTLTGLGCSGRKPAVVGAEEHRAGKFTIGKETTYFEGPVDKDGYIDYVAALNERLRKGVTPE